MPSQHSVGSSLSYTFSPQRLKMVMLNSMSSSLLKQMRSFTPSALGVKALGITNIGAPQITSVPCMHTESVAVQPDGAVATTV